jgi:peptidyl-prolyl cis-trans isomerase C
MSAMKTMRGAVLALALACACAQAQTPPADPVLAENGNVKVYRSEYEAELLKLAPDVRPGFANNQRRIAELVLRLLIQKSLAAQPETVALAQSPLNATRIRLESERVLAQLRLEDVERRAGMAFDARRADYESRARELYAVERRKFEVPEQVAASHILFDTHKHTRDEARRLADEARARIVAGADFNEVAKEVSEDPSAKQNAGKLGWFARAEMDPAFATAAFALKQKGEVSEPVLSSFGWHIIRLEDRRAAAPRPYEDVRDVIMGELRKKYVDEQREAAIAAVRDAPGVTLNQGAIEALFTRPTVPEGALAPSAPPSRAPGTPPLGLRPGGPAPK